MLSIRSVAHSLPRVARLTSSPLVSRNLGTASVQVARLRPSWRPVSAPFASFSTSTVKREVESSINQELAVKLESERMIEIDQQQHDSNTYPEDLQEYLDNTAFKLQDVDGEGLVTLTRQFGDENIRVCFDIEDLDNMDQDGMMSDESLMDELDDPADIPVDGQPSGRSKGAINQGRGSGGNFKTAPEDSISAADAEGEEATQDERGFPVHVEVTIERPGKGVLQIDAIAEDSLFSIDSVNYFKDNTLAKATRAEKHLKTQDLYTGPPFGNLDEDLQLLFERYLDERGIDVGMATFIPNFIEFKEQKEYVRWLENVKGIVE